NSLPAFPECLIFPAKSGIDQPKHAQPRRIIRVSLHNFFLLSSSSSERRDGFFMIIGHSRNKTFYERASEFYDVIAVLVFSERCQGIGSAGGIAFGECAGKPVIGYVFNISRILRADLID